MIGLSPGGREIGNTNQVNTRTVDLCRLVPTVYS